MASDVEIANVALTLLGTDRIMSLSDNVKAAREIDAVYTIARDGMLGAYNWSFAKTRAKLPELATAPAFEYLHQYAMPEDCLRLMFVGDYYAGLDLTDYRGASTKLFEIEQRNILTDIGAPLNIKYVKRIEDPELFPPAFVNCFAAELAYMVAEAITESNTKKEFAAAQRRHYVNLAIRANAIELPPEKLPDDEWLIARL